MIKFTTMNGLKLLISPSEVKAVSSTKNPELVEIAFVDGGKILVRGTVAEVFAELEREDGDEQLEAD